MNALPAVSTGTVFDLVADRHRRAALTYLENTSDGRASLTDLAAYVSQHAWADNSPPRIAARLHHIHLPKITRTGIVDYDAGDGTVRYVGHPLIEACIGLADHATSEDDAP